MRRSFGMSLPAALAFVWFAAPAQATVAYQNTTTAVTAYVFNGASASTLATNIDINLLTLMPGFAGDVVSSISFRAYNSNGASVAAGLVFDVWATNGTGGLPGALLASTTIAPLSLGPQAETTVAATFASGLIVPTTGMFYVGVGYTNGGGTSPVTATQLNQLGGVTFNPASVGANSAQAYFADPGTTGSNPSVTPFGTPFGSDYGFTVNVPEPASLGVLLTGLLVSGIGRGRRRAC